MSELTAKALSDSRSFENAILERDMRMKKAGWIVAALAGLLLVFALAALILLLPLKTTTVELYTLDREAPRGVQLFRPSAGLQRDADVQQRRGQQGIPRLV